MGMNYNFRETIHKGFVYTFVPLMTIVCAVGAVYKLYEGRAGDALALGAIAGAEIYAEYELLREML